MQAPTLNWFGSSEVRPSDTLSTFLARAARERLAHSDLQAGHSFSGPLSCLRALTAHHPSAFSFAPSLMSADPLPSPYDLPVCSVISPRLLPAFSLEAVSWPCVWHSHPWRDTDLCSSLGSSRPLSPDLPKATDPQLRE